jgi:hypothetical protein
MTDHKYTDEEVIRALECCVNGTSEACLKCTFGLTPPYPVCKTMVEKYALDLINRQRAEIKALEMDNAQLQSDIINANQNSDHIKGLWEAEREKVEKAKQKVVNACKMLKNARAEAIKEFAERLETALLVGGIYPVIVKNTIHSLVKEMTGGDQNG